MATLKDFDRWNRVQQKADELKSIVVNGVVSAYEEYRKVFGPLKQYDRIPDHIDEIFFNGDNLCVQGDSYYRGCTDRESFYIPVAFAFGTREERDAMIAKYRADQEAAARAEEARIAAEEEAKQRNLYEELKAKFGD